LVEGRSQVGLVQREAGRRLVDCSLKQILVEGWAGIRGLGHDSSIIFKGADGGEHAGLGS